MIEGAVLHHHHDDVVDLGEVAGVDRHGRWRDRRVHDLDWGAGCVADVGDVELLDPAQKFPVAFTEQPGGEGPGKAVQFLTQETGQPDSKIASVNIRATSVSPPVRRLRDHLECRLPVMEAWAQHEEDVKVNLAELNRRPVDMGRSAIRSPTSAKASLHIRSRLKRSITPHQGPDEAAGARCVSLVA